MNAGQRGRPPVVIVQPQVPHYRVDFFRRVAAGLQRPLRIIHGTRAAGDSLPDAVIGGDVQQDAVPWSRLPLPGRQPSLRGLWRAVTRQRPWTLILPANPNYLGVHLLWAWALVARVRVLGWGQLLGADARPWVLRLKLAWIRAFAGFFTYTAEEAALARRHGCGSRVRSLDNGLAPRPALPADAAQVHADGPFIHCARLEPKNRPELVLRAWCAYRTQGGRRALQVIGDGSLRPALEALVADLPLRSELRLHGAVYEPERVEALIAGSFAMIHPSGVGLSIATAFQQGCPLIACADPRRHMPEFWLWREGLTGWGWDEQGTDAAASLAEVLRRADATGLPRYRGMRAACRHASSRASTVRMAAQLLAGLSATREREECR